MKETDIVQALRCCAEGECKDCAMHEDKQRCQENLLDKAAEAIERLTAENAALREKVPRRSRRWTISYRLRTGQFTGQKSRANAAGNTRRVRFWTTACVPRAIRRQTMPDEYISREAALTALQDSDLFNTTERQLRAIRELPAADVAEVVHGTPVTEVRTRTIVGYHEEIGVLAGDRSTLYRRNMVHVDIPYDYCPVCGATLCSRWHNFCGKCGAKMDGAAE